MPIHIHAIHDAVLDAHVGPRARGVALSLISWLLASQMPIDILRLLKDPTRHRAAPLAVRTVGVAGGIDARGSIGSLGALQLVQQHVKLRDVVPLQLNTYMCMLHICMCMHTLWVLP